MAYNKTVWKDQDVENPRTYTQRQNDDGSVTLLDHFGTITELGTPVNAENMNKIENGIAAAVEKSSIKQDLSTPSADTVPSTKAVSNESSRIMSIMDNQYSNLLSTLYPVGSIYIGTQNSCPLTSLIAGSSWQKVATQVVTDVNTSVAVYGNGKTLGLSNGSQNFAMTDGGYGNVGGFMQGATNVFGANKGTIRTENTIIGADRKSVGVVQDSNTSGLTGSLSRTNLSLNIWKRTA